MEIINKFGAYLSKYMYLFAKLCAFNGGLAIVAHFAIKYTNPNYFIIYFICLLLFYWFGYKTRLHIENIKNELILDKEREIQEQQEIEEEKEQEKERKKEERKKKKKPG